VTFYEVHDEDGCLAKTKQFKVAKRSAIAFQAMKSGRRVHIRQYGGGMPSPRTIELDPATGTWTMPEQPALSSAAS
jgi:hypothetical protein